MGAAPMAYVLWTRHLRYDPANPDWINRDRFVLSAGHGSMLLYSLLYPHGVRAHSRRPRALSAVGKPDARPSRAWESLPASKSPPGRSARDSETPSEWRSRSDGSPPRSIGRVRTIVDHRTYVIASDGDLMEGVSSEAASLAGDLQLGRLIVLYDANHITLSATTNITFSRRRRRPLRCLRMAGAGDRRDGRGSGRCGAHRSARRRASPVAHRRAYPHRIRKPEQARHFEAHGEPLGKNEVRLTKRAYGWPEDAQFYVPDEARREFDKVARARRGSCERRGSEMMDEYRAAHRELARAFDRAIAGELAPQWDAKLPVFTPKDGDMATRDAGGKAIAVLAESVPNLMGGSADLDPSTRTMMKEKGDFQSADVPEDGQTPPTQGMAGGVWGYAGRNIHFGIREHAMTAILTGMAHHGGVIPFGATFLTFSDYMRPSIRLAALSDAHVIYVWTHDSIALGRTARRISRWSRSPACGRCRT